MTFAYVAERFRRRLPFSLGTLAGPRSLASRLIPRPFKGKQRRKPLLQPMDLARPLERRDHSAARPTGSSRTRESQGRRKSGRNNQLERSVQRKC